MPLEIVSLMAPQAVDPGGTFDAEAVVSNQTDRSLTDVVLFSVNGQTLGSKEVSVAPGRQRAVTQQLSVPTSEPDDVAIGTALQGGVGAEVIVVNPTTPTVTMGDIDVDPPAPQPGQSVTTSLGVSNGTGETVTNTISVRRDDAFVRTETVNVGPGGTASVEYTFEWPEGVAQTTVTFSTASGVSAHTIITGEGTPPVTAPGTGFSRVAIIGGVLLGAWLLGRGR